MIRWMPERNPCKYLPFSLVLKIEIYPCPIEARLPKNDELSYTTPITDPSIFGFTHFSCVGGTPVMQCPRCDKFYTNRNSFNRHKNYECEGIAPKFHCDRKSIIIHFHFWALRQLTIYFWLVRVRSTVSTKNFFTTSSMWFAAGRRNERGCVEAPLTVVVILSS